MILYYILGAITAVIAVILTVWIMRTRETGKILESFDTALYMVLMPKYDVTGENATSQDRKEMIGKMEQVYANFLYSRRDGLFTQLFHGPPRISFEVASQTGGSDIEFYIAVPKDMGTAFEKYITGIYPRAIIEPVPEDYTPFEPGGESAGAYLLLRESPLFPLQTYRELEQDPLSALTNSLSKIHPEEGAAIQVVIAPADQAHWRGLGDRLMQKVTEGKTVRSAVRDVSRSLFGDIFWMLVSGLSGKKDQNDMYAGYHQMHQEDQHLLDAVRSKIQKPVFSVNVRMVTSARDKERAQEILNHLIGSFGQFSLSSYNSLRDMQVRGRNLKKLIYNYSFRHYNSPNSMVLNVEELASLYHFPTKFIETPYVKMAETGSAAPPSELPSNGVNVIGRVKYRGDERQVAFADREDRRRHFYVIGQTGTGKSSLLQEMIRQDIENGEGVGLIDPHGDLVEATLANIPKERAEDVVLFEPFDMQNPMGLNMLEYETDDQKDFAVQEMISIFHKLFPPEIIGPMFEHYMRNAMLALMGDKDNPGTLVEIPKMFTDDEFMERKMERVSDPVVRNFWLQEWRQMTGRTKSDMLGYIVSKVGRFIENEMMRNIIGQQYSTIDLEDIMNGRKIFLANLSKGRTGEVNSSLLGLLLVSKMQMAAMKRGQVPENQRADFYLYVDEFQNFTTDSIATILSEARKYRLNLILAHQYIPQLTEDIKNAVIGNVGSIGAFRVGAQDAEFLERQFQPEFTQFDLVNLGNFNLISRMMINGKLYSPFRVETMPPKQNDSLLVESIKSISKLKYAKDREDVENDFATRYTS